MVLVLALIGALALAAVPVQIGWKRGWHESQMARAFGLDIENQKRRFNPEVWAAQTGTGLTFKQIAYGAVIWIVGGAVAGLTIGGFVQAITFAIAGGLFYVGSLNTKREEKRLKVARDIVHAIGIIRSLLREGVSFQNALDQATEAAGPDGRVVLADLRDRLNAVSPERYAEVVQEWSQRWENPAVDLLAGGLLAALRARIEMVKLMNEIQQTLRQQVQILSRGRAEARGIEWQAKLLALFPPGVLVLIRLTSGMGDVWANPKFIMPTLLGAGLSYYLSMRMVKSRLSLEASLGLLPAGQGEIPVDRFGNPL